jgi:hypothetical protein
MISYGATTRNNPNNIPSGALIGGVANFFTNTKPTTRVDGTALVVGDLWYNPSNGVSGFWNGTAWLSSNLFKATAASVPLNSVGGSTTGWGGDLADIENIFITNQWLNVRFVPLIAGDKWGAIISFRNASDFPVATLPLIEAISPSSDTYTYRISAVLNTFYNLPALLATVVLVGLIKTGTPSNFVGSVGFNYRIVL